MGMPTTAIYVILATVIAPALIEMGMTPMAAHLFIFYFGVLSFLTPPVAVSSYVAAGACRRQHVAAPAGSGMQLSISPAVALRLGLRSVAAARRLMALDLDRDRHHPGRDLLISRGLLSMHVGKVMGTVIRIALTLAAIAMATAPVWLGRSWRPRAPSRLLPPRRVNGGRFGA